jgi:hypothetical protein
MSGFNGISEQHNGNGKVEQCTDLIGQLAAIRLQLDRLANLNSPITTEVRVQLHLALDHVDDAIARHEKWQQTRAIEAASGNVRKIAV